MSIGRIGFNSPVRTFNYGQTRTAKQIKASNISFKGNDTKNVNPSKPELLQREDIKNAKDYISKNAHGDVRIDEQGKNVLKSARYLLENGIRPVYKHGYTEARKGTLLAEGFYSETFDKLFNYCVSENIDMKDFINLASTIVVDPNSKDYNLETANKLLEITKSKGLKHNASTIHPLSCLIGISDNEKSDKLSGEEFMKIIDFAIKKDVDNTHLGYLLNASSPENIKSGKISIKNDKLIVFDDSNWDARTLSLYDCSPRYRGVYVNGKLAADYRKENQWCKGAVMTKYGDDGIRDFSFSYGESGYEPKILYYTADGKYAASKVPIDKDVQKENITKVYKALTSSDLADVLDAEAKKHVETAAKDFVDAVKEIHGADLEKLPAFEEFLAKQGIEPSSINDKDMANLFIAHTKVQELEQQKQEQNQIISDIYAKYV